MLGTVARLPGQDAAPRLDLPSSSTRPDGPFRACPVVATARASSEASGPALPTPASPGAVAIDVERRADVGVA